MRRIFLALVCIGSALVLAGCNEQSLYTGLKREDANQIAALLQSVGIEAKLSEDVHGQSLSVSVPSSRSSEAIAVLARAGLPKHKEGSLRDVLTKDTWMATPMEERARLGYGLSQELTSTLTSIPGIVDARVHLALAEKNGLGETTSTASASVLVRYDTQIMGSEFQENISSLVANSVPGLSYDRVTVTMVPYEAETQLISATNMPAAPAAYSRYFESLLKVLAVLVVALVATAVLLRVMKVQR